MAVFGAGVNDPVTVKRWAKAVDAIVVSQTSFHKFSGGDESLCETQSELTEKPGDRVTTFLRAKPAGDSVPHGTTLEGNEDTVDFFEDYFFMAQQRYGVRIPWENMDQQRVPFTLRDKARAQTADFAEDRIDEIFFRHLCGDTLTNSLAEPTLRNGGNTVVEYDANHTLYANGATSEEGSGATSVSGTPGKTLQLSDVRKMVKWTKTRAIPIRPLKVSGGEYFVLFLHPDQLEELKSDTGAGNWNELYQNALLGGMVKDNPMFTGAAGIVDGCLIVENVRVRNGLNAAKTAYVNDVRRGVFCGAQTAISGYGMFGGRWEQGKYKWVEETFDYEEELGVAVKWIHGLKRAIYNSETYGSFLIPSYSVES
jgi:N4-gp56 family major capsid protein